MSEESDPFLHILGSYKAAVLAKDVNAFAALYDDDVHIFDMWGAWSFRGIDAWRTMVADWFSSLGTEHVIVNADAVRTTLSGDLAIGHAILTYTAMSADGVKLRSLSNRITMGLRRVGVSWKVFHEHTSTPIDHTSTKAILQYSSDG